MVSESRHQRQLPVCAPEQTAEPACHYPLRLDTLNISTALRATPPHGHGANPWFQSSAAVAAYALVLIELDIRSRCVGSLHLTSDSRELACISSDPFLFA